MKERTFRDGDRCHKYVIESLLGAGGMGEVYIASDPFLKRKVAIKTVGIERAKVPRFIKGFMSEAQVMAELNHPSIARFYDAAVTDSDQPYLVMELVDGKPLGYLCAQWGALEAETSLSIALQICEGLRAAHRVQIVHRDLKPDNVLVQRGGYVKVIDFGLARSLAKAGAGSTDHFANMGTPHYMAPEQVLRQKVGPPADIYSLGVLLYQMLAGHHMFAESSDEMPTRAEVQAYHVHAEPTPLTELLYGVDAIWAVLKAMLAKEPEQRPDADALARELKRLLPLYRSSDVDAGGRLPVPEIDDPWNRASAIEPRAPRAAVKATLRKPDEADAPRVSREMLAFLTAPVGEEPRVARRTLPFMKPARPRLGLGHTTRVEAPPAVRIEAPRAVAPPSPRTEQLDASAFVAPFAEPLVTPRDEPPAPQVETLESAQSGVSATSVSIARASSASIRRTTASRKVGRRKLALAMMTAASLLGVVAAFVALLIFGRPDAAPAIEPPLVVPLVAASSVTIEEAPHEVDASASASASASANPLAPIAPKAKPAPGPAPKPGPSPAPAATSKPWFDDEAPGSGSSLPKDFIPFDPPTSGNDTPAPTPTATTPKPKPIEGERVF